MIRNVTTAVLLLAAAGAAQAKLEIKNVQAAYGVLGPERKSTDVFAGDEILFRFTVSGVKADADGKHDGLIGLKLTNANGDIVLLQDNAIKPILSLGGGSFFAHARVNLGEKAPPGEYTLTVTFTDKVSSEKTSFDRKISCKAPEFALGGIEFSYDPDGRIPAPAGGIEGQTLWFRMHSIGIDRSQKKIDTGMSVQVLDAQGKELLPKPTTAEFKTEDPQVVNKIPFVPYRGSIVLNRPGDFTLRVTVTDNIAKKTTKFEAPVRVTPLSK